MASNRAALLFTLAVAASAQILTSQYDNARTNATLHETVLTPANVNVRQFGRIFTLPVDGDVYAQPLYLPNVEIPGKGAHNVLYVATEHDSVYAFDADSANAARFWRVSFLGDGVDPVPARDVRCPFIRPEIGITPTPVIDLPSGTLYVLARTKEHGEYVQKLHAIAITTGAEKFGGPVEIKASGFDPLRELPRAGLLLSNGQVYLTWASSCDVGPYHGWVMAYDAHTLKQTAVFNTSPTAEESGIWQSDNAPAADAEGNVYLATGNGKFTARSGGRDYGDTALKLALTPAGFVVRDYFTPPDEAALNREDADLGSGGPVLLSPNLLLVGAKDGTLHVLEREHMREVQSLKFRDGFYAAPSYWNGHVYILPSSEWLRDLPLESGRLNFDKMKSGTQRFANAGANPTISANGTRNGIVWVIESKTWNGPDKPAILHAYDASDVSRELYNSEQNSARDRAGLTTRFTIPTIVNGRVFIDAKGEVDVYGLLAPR